MVRLWSIIKEFWLNHAQHAWAEMHILYLAIIAGIIVSILFIAYMIKITRENKIIDKKSKQTRRHLIKSLGYKENKTH